MNLKLKSHFSIFSGCKLRFCLEFKQNKRAMHLANCRQKSFMDYVMRDGSFNTALVQVLGRSTLAIPAMASLVLPAGQLLSAPKRCCSRAAVAKNKMMMSVCV